MKDLTCSAGKRQNTMFTKEAGDWPDVNISKVVEFVFVEEVKKVHAVLTLVRDYCSRLVWVYILMWETARRFSTVRLAHQSGPSRNGSSAYPSMCDVHDWCQSSEDFKKSARKVSKIYDALLIIYPPFLFPIIYECIYLRIIAGFVLDLWGGCRKKKEDLTHRLVVLLSTLTRNIAVAIHLFLWWLWLR